MVRTFLTAATPRYNLVFCSLLAKHRGCLGNLPYGVHDIYARQVKASLIGASTKKLTGPLSMPFILVNLLSGHKPLGDRRIAWITALYHDTA